MTISERMARQIDDLARLQEQMAGVHSQPTNVFTNPMEDQRAPLFTNEEWDEMDKERREMGMKPFDAFDMRAFYERKITSGELIVAKTTRNTIPKCDQWAQFACSVCEQEFSNEQGVRFCPGCGCKIIE